MRGTSYQDLWAGAGRVESAPPPQPPAAGGQREAAPAGAVAPWTGAGALATPAVIAARVVVVVAEPEEPDQPDDQQADVEDAKSDHEDPPLGGHRGPMLPRCQPRKKGSPCLAAPTAIRAVGGPR